MDQTAVGGAAAIAEKSLRSNIRRLGAVGPTILTAGARQFRSVWTRDFCFAAGGLLALGEAGVVRATLDLLLSHQRPDGYFPRLLDSMNPFLRVGAGSLGLSFELRESLKPNYVSEHGILTADSQSLLAWTAARLARISPDQAWLRTVMPRLERGMAWFSTIEKDGLLRQAPFSDWKDSVTARRGAVFFTELLRWLAFGSMAELAASAEDEESASRWMAKSAAHRDRLDAAFWSAHDGFYRDTLEFPLLSADGNLAAIVWGFATDEKAERILGALERLGMWTAWGPKAGQRYPAREKGWLVRLAGIPGYHDDFVWLWTSALALLALDRPGHFTRRDALLETLCHKIVAAGEVSEVYRPEDGRPVRTWLYSSEAPFSWSSGMLLESFKAVAATPGA